jgi:hypothetical protein
MAEKTKQKIVGIKLRVETDKLLFDGSDSELSGPRFSFELIPDMQHVRVTKSLGGDKTRIRSLPYSGCIFMWDAE